MLLVLFLVLAWCFWCFSRCFPGASGAYPGACLVLAWCFWCFGTKKVELCLTILKHSMIVHDLGLLMVQSHPEHLAEMHILCSKGLQSNRRPCHQRHIRSITLLSKKTKTISKVWRKGNVSAPDTVRDWDRSPGGCNGPRGKGQWLEICGAVYASPVITTAPPAPQQQLQ